jgi:hypothetical protein
MAITRLHIVDKPFSQLIFFIFTLYHSHLISPFPLYYPHLEFHPQRLLDLLLIDVPAKDNFLKKFLVGHLQSSVMSNSLDQLKATGTTVVCDSGDFATIGKYKPQDATTTPSLILAASKNPAYSKLINSAVAYGREHGDSLDNQVDSALAVYLWNLARKF